LEKYLVPDNNLQKIMLNLIYFRDSLSKRFLVMKTTGKIYPSKKEMKCDESTK
jgi:hypothetical protein